MLRAFLLYLIFFICYDFLAFFWVPLIFFCRSISSTGFLTVFLFIILLMFVLRLTLGSLTSSVSIYYRYCRYSHFTFYTQQFVSHFSIITFHLTFYIPRFTNVITLQQCNSIYSPAFTDLIIGKEKVKPPHSDIIAYAENSKGYISY